MRNLVVLALMMICAGCVTIERVQFQAQIDQKTTVRDGNPSIVSEKPTSIVIVRPASRQFQSDARPIFVIAMHNRGSSSQDFWVQNVQVTQSVNGKSERLKVFSFEELVQEENFRQFLAEASARSRAQRNYSAASQAGFVKSNSTVQTPSGALKVQTTVFNPVAAAIAQERADAENRRLIAATIERGQENLAQLEADVIKDNTLLPGEWYGGQLHIQPLVSTESNVKIYTISIQIGADRHDIQISQAKI